MQMNYDAARQVCQKYRLRKANRVNLHINAIYQNPNGGGKLDKLSSKCVMCVVTCYFAISLFQQFVNLKTLYA